MNNLQIEVKLKEWIEFKELCLKNQISKIEEIKWLYDKLILGGKINSL